MENNVVQIFQSPETLDDWKAYIAEATAAEKRANQTKVEAILEKGKRILEFHDAFKAQGHRWGRRWNDLCLEIVGLEHRTCQKYEVIAKNVGLLETNISFPADIQAIVYLIRTKLADQETFQAAVAAGEITPKTNRFKAEEIMRRAEAKSPKPRQEIRRHPKTGVPVWGKYNRPVIIPSKKTLEERKKPQPMLTIPMRDVTERLNPIIKSLKQQSKCSMATVSFTALVVLAGDLEHLVEEWMSGGTGSERTPNSANPSALDERKAL
jgi:hypothetical protein